MAKKKAPAKPTKKKPAKKSNADFNNHALKKLSEAGILTGGPLADSIREAINKYYPADELGGVITWTEVEPYLDEIKRTVKGLGQRTSPKPKAPPKKKTEGEQRVTVQF